MNIDIFSGKAEVYALARPGYPAAALAYLAELLPCDPAIADIGAGTGKLTVPLAQGGGTVYAVEPNADMRAQLVAALAPHPSAAVFGGSAEATTLPDGCADAVVSAQALHWFDLDAFYAECRRVLKPGGLVITVYNLTPGGSSAANCARATGAFYRAPAIRDFPNPMWYDREHWLAYMTSHSHDPLPGDADYAAHIAEVNAIFDRENVDGRLCRDVVTRVFNERLGWR